MKKNEILEKSRNEKNDEYEKKVLTSGQTFSLYAMLGVFALFIVINTFFLKIINQYDYCAILFAFVASSFFYRFIKTKNNKFLIAGILSAFIVVCSSVLYIITALGII